MNDTEDKLFDLLDKWAMLHKQGKHVVVQELCRDCPELVEELERRIATLKATDWLDRPLDDSNEPSLDRTKPDDFDLPDHLGRYRLDQLIGVGGFGQVWQGFDPDLQRPVAIKIPRPDRVSTLERIQRFVEEAQRVAKLKHVGIVPIYDVGRDGQRCYIVSDLIEGRNLAEVIASNRPSLVDACRIVSEVARILNYAHDLGFIHRDVKPANILLDQHGKVFLTDFGIAATVEELSQPTSSTGTLPYMSPEALAGEPVDPRTDIYSLGVVMFELLSATDPVRTREQVVAGGAFPGLEAATISAELKAICRKCLAADREDRFERASELADSLDKLFDKRSRIGLWIGVVLLIGLITALWKPDFWSNEESANSSERLVAASHHDPTTFVISEPLHTFEQTTPISSLAFDSDAEQVFVGRADGTAVLVNLDGDESQPIKLDNTSEVTALAVAPNGSRIACGCANGLVRMWDVSQSPPRELNTLAGHPAPIRVLAFNDEGSALVTGSGNTAQIWDLTVSPPQMAKLPEAEGSILAVEFVGDELAVGIGGAAEKPGQLWFWQVAMAEKQLHPIDTKPIDRINGVEDFAFSADGRFMVAVHDGGKVAVLELEVHPEHRRRAIRMVGYLEQQSEPVTAIQFLPNSELMAFGRGSNVEIWNVRTNQQVARIEESNPIQCFALSQNGRNVATGTQSDVRTWLLPSDLFGSE